MPKGRSQKIGKLGEDTLAAWAHQVDFTITKPTEDEQGWDFLLEAEPPSISANPLTTDKPVYERSWIDTRAGVPNQAVKTMLQSIQNKYVDSRNVVIMEEYQNLLDAK